MGTDKLLEFKGEDKMYPDDAWVAAPVKSGSLVLIHGQVMPHQKYVHTESSRQTCRFTTSLSETQATSRGTPTPSTSLRLRARTTPARTGCSPQLSRCCLTPYKWTTYKKVGWNIENSGNLLSNEHKNIYFLQENGWENEVKQNILQTRVPRWKL